MAEQYPNVINFNGGQTSPKVNGRIDLEDYDSFLKDMTSFIPLKQGEAQAMTGFLYGETTRYAAQKSIFIPFQYSATDSFWLEFGDLYMRVVDPDTGLYVVKTSAAAWQGSSYGYVIGDYVLESTIIYYCIEAHASGTFATDLAAGKWVQQTAVEIPTPYTEAQLYDIQYQNLNDLVVLTHGSHLPQDITRVSDTSWTIADYAQDWPAFLRENQERDHYITPSGTLTVGGTATLTASGTGNTPFDDPTDNMVGSYFAVTQKREAISANFDLESVGIAGTTPGVDILPAKGDWTFKTDILNVADIGTETLTLDRSDDGGSTYYTIFTVTFVPGYTGFDVSGTIDEDDVLLRVQLTSAGTNTTSQASVTLNIEGADISGYGQITFVDSTTVARMTVIAEIESTQKTNRFREGGWSEKQGYPKASTHFEQRMYFGGTTLEPTAIWASATDDLSNFDFRSTSDDQAFHRIIDNSQNAIQWMARKDSVFAGSAGEEFKISSTNEQEAITPSNVTVKVVGGAGSALIKPVSVGDGLIFVTLNGIQVRELAFNQQGALGTDQDLTELSDEITGTGIKQITYQQYPNKTVYMVRDDGVLVGFVRDKNNNINAWFTRPTDGVVESVVSTRSGTNTSDPLGIIVKRVIGGADIRFIERLAPISDTNSEWVFMDSAKQVTALGGPVVTGADHLEGQTVKVMNDGAVETDKVVTSGTFTLDNTSTTKLVYGLDYEAEFTTLPLRRSGSSGNSKVLPKSLSHIMLGVRQSSGGQYGYEILNDEGIVIQTVETVAPINLATLVFGVPIAPQTRYHILDVDGGHGREIAVRIIRNEATPLNVTHAIPSLEVGR